MAHLKLNNLYKSYGVTEVIRGINIDIKNGEFCVVVGPSGCGKSTVLRMIAGLEPVTSGTIEMNGKIINQIPAAHRGLAMVFQSYALYPHMSVRQNMSFGLENMGVPKSEIIEQVDHIAKMLKIDKLMNRKPKQLSGGQRQRVAIGRAMVRKPKIFLFDEPLSSLDAKLRITMRGEISELNANRKNTMIYVTHDQVEAMTLADKIVVLNNGCVEQIGAPLDLFNCPGNRFVAGFIGSPSMSFFKGKVDINMCILLENGANIQLPEGVYNIEEGQKIELGVRAGDVYVSQSDEGVKALVCSVEKLGEESYLYCCTHTNEPLIIYQRGQTSIKKGDNLNLKFNSEAIHIFDLNTGFTCRT